MAKLEETRARIERLKADGREPTRIVLSFAAWNAIKAEFIAETGRDPRDAMISSQDVFGLPLRLFPQMLAIAIEWDRDGESGVDESDKSGGGAAQ